jgi:hypothetical protein
MPLATAIAAVNRAMVKPRAGRSAVGKDLADLRDINPSRAFRWK